MEEIREIVEEVLSILADFDGDTALDIICDGNVDKIMKYIQIRQIL